MLRQVSPPYLGHAGSWHSEEDGRPLSYKNLKSIYAAWLLLACYNGAKILPAAAHGSHFIYFGCEMLGCVTEILALKLSPLFSSTWIEKGFRRSSKVLLGRGCMAVQGMMFGFEE